MKPQIKPGIVVKSQKGRDKGRLFMVLYQVDADFVMVCDGKLRKLDKPKKKRCKHLTALPYEMEQHLALYAANRLKDSDIRKELDKILYELTDRDKA
ncbi:MAG: KOW domain-containing RNA-binding protein [Eubacteriales bacterium]|nr:KOW domain-containing RNA-binding protein [Eubacteriales bacterium]